MKRWKYRKVTPTLVKKMRLLKNQGLTFVAIGKQVNLSPSTVGYWLNPSRRIKQLGRVNNYWKTHQRKKQQRTEYMRKYMSNRYRKDPEFRARMKRHMKKWKSSEHGKKHLQEYDKEYRRKKKEEND